MTTVPTHPLVLALAIKQLMAEKTFEPAESELRAALEKVEQRLTLHRSYLSGWLGRLERADEIVFTFDRPAWDRAYANVHSDVPRQMRARLFEDGPGEPNEDGNEIPPSPRWQALNDLWETKLAAEEAAEKVAVLPEQQTDDAVACAKAAARKTHKPKRKR